MWKSGCKCIFQSAAKRKCLQFYVGYCHLPKFSSVHREKKAVIAALLFEACTCILMHTQWCSLLNTRCRDWVQRFFFPSSSSNSRKEVFLLKGIPSNSPPSFSCSHTQWCQDIFFRQMVAKAVFFPAPPPKTARATTTTLYTRQGHFSSTAQRKENVVPLREHLDGRKSRQICRENPYILWSKTKKYWVFRHFGTKKPYDFSRQTRRDFLPCNWTLSPLDLHQTVR